MCIAKILSLFKKKNPPTPEPEPVLEPTTEPLTIPHPEEPPDYSRTIENTEANEVVHDWLVGWKVPAEYWDYWFDYNIMISLQYQYPAATSSETNQMWLRPEWANEGVIAHELAHESYSLLSEDEKANFELEYNEYLVTDSLMILLHSGNSYMNTNIIEAHAEVYRYLGDKMPEALKKYYPKLL